MNKTMVMAVIAVLAIVTSANAGAYYGEDFDSYAIGSNMNGQGGWVDWDPSGPGGIVTQDRKIDSDNIIAIEGASDLCYDQMDYTSGIVDFSIDQYIPSTSTGKTYVILLDDHLVSPKWAMQLSFDLDAGTLKAEMDDALGTFDILKDQWAAINARIDLDNNTVKVYYEGTLIRDGAWVGDDKPVQLTTLDLFANGADVVYYDDVAVPEPATLCLLALGGLVLRRRTA